MKRADKRKEGVPKVQSFLIYWYFWARGMSDFLNKENGPQVRYTVMGIKERSLKGAE